jgi:prophage maintenance system killer protein
LTNIFLKRNGWRLETNTTEIVEMVLAVESDAWKVDEIENWLRPRVIKL